MYNVYVHWNPELMKHNVEESVLDSDRDIKNDQTY